MAETISHSHLASLTQVEKNRALWKEAVIPRNHNNVLALINHGASVISTNPDTGSDHILYTTIKIPGCDLTSDILIKYGAFTGPVLSMSLMDAAISIPNNLNNINLLYSHKIYMNSMFQLLHAIRLNDNHQVVKSMLLKQKCMDLSFVTNIYGIGIERESPLHVIVDPRIDIVMFTTVLDAISNVNTFPSALDKLIKWDFTDTAKIKADMLIDRGIDYSFYRHRQLALSYANYNLAVYFNTRRPRLSCLCGPVFFKLCQ